MNEYIEFKNLLENIKNSGKRPTLLLHSCCGPCSSYVINMLNEYFDITIFYYNPNIYPHEEFIKRYQVQLELIKKMNLDINVVMVDEDYDVYLKNVEGYTHLKEGSMRCYKCYEFRFKKLSEYASKHDFDYFSTVMNFDKSLELLLDFVQTPCFIEESVESEKLIIEQEIMSSLDKPASVCYHGILKNLFKENKIIDDIGGTKESIQEINKDILQKCYNTFYHPSNMILVVTGNFDLDKTLALIENNQANKDFGPYLNPIVINHFESNKVNKEYDSYMMDVNTNSVSVGLKLDLHEKTPKEILKIAILFDFILEEKFDYSSENYQKWLREHIIDYTFTFNFSLCKTHAYITIDGQANDPNVFIDVMRKELLNIPYCEFIEDRFYNFIRSHIGYQIRKFNSVEAIANSLNDEAIDGTDLFDKIETLQNLKFADLKEVYEYFDKEAISSFVVLPK